MKKILLIPAVCLTLFSCGGNSSTNNSVRIAQSQADTQSSDWQITLNVKEALLSDGNLSAGNRFISVSTTNGVVTLTGGVSSEDQMNEIVKIVKGVPGVVSVDNQLTISNG